MIVHISSALLDAIVAHAARTPNLEICGLLFGTDDRIDAAEPARNVHADPARHFEIDPAALIAAHKAQRAGGRRLIGHYHSHPTGDATPSDEDERSAQGGTLSLIVGGDVARLYRSMDRALVPITLRTT